MNSLLYHFGTIDITPQEPVYLDGFANRNGLSQGVHRPLTNRCLILRDTHNTVCLIVNDLCEITKEYIDWIKDRITYKTGLGPDQIFIHNIHTHSAPVMTDMIELTNPSNLQYRQQVCQLIAENAISCLQKKNDFLKAGVQYGTVRSFLGVNRRYIDQETGRAIISPNRAGAADPGVNIVRLVRENGTPGVVLFNYACHPVTLGYTSRVISPDYPGRAREVLENRWDCPALFLNGAAGDINLIEGLRADTAITGRLGEQLARTILSGSFTDVGPPLEIRHATRCIRLPYRDQNVTPQWIDREVERKLSEKTEFKSWQTDLRKGGEFMKKKLANDAIPNERKMQLGAVRIGPVVWFFTQGEIFVNYQLQLKKAFPEYHILFMGYTDGESVYLPTAESFAQKGYEVDQAYIYLKEPSPLKAGVEEIFLAEAKSVMEEISCTPKNRKV